MKYIKEFSIIAILTVSFSGCAPKMIKATPEKDMAAKEFKLDSEKANLYICRNESFGSAVAMPVTVDGKFIGKTDGYSYFYLKLKPGKHEIKSLSENIQTLTLEMEKNKNYFVWQEIKMGTRVADSKLHKVDKKFGEYCILETEMLKNTTK